MIYIHKMGVLLVVRSAYDVGERERSVDRRHTRDVRVHRLAVKQAEIAYRNVHHRAGVNDVVDFSGLDQVVDVVVIPYIVRRARIAAAVSGVA